MKVLQLAGRVILASVAIGASAIAIVYARTEWLMRHRVPVPEVQPLTIATDSASIARGAHFASAVAGCTHCHGKDLGGDTVVNEPGMLRLTAPNLTTGRGGVLRRYGNTALDVAIRHGVAPDGRVLIIMPSHEYAGYADDHVAAIIAYLRSRPPVDRTVAPIWIGPLIRALNVAGQITLFPYYKIDHARRPTAIAPTGPTVEHGRYIAQGCTGCHGPNLSGGPIAGAPPDWPPAANLTPTGIGSWTDADFVRALRDGKRPDGTAISPRMPWQQLGAMTDDELIALRRYLATVAPAATGSR
jgi:cytochrome c553